MDNMERFSAYLEARLRFLKSQVTHNEFEEERRIARIDEVEEFLDIVEMGRKPR